MQYSDFEKKLQNCRNKKVLLGFSGGADSCALFLILVYWHRRIPFDFTAVHFEHGLRGGESLADADFCEKTAARYGVKFQKYSLNVPENMLPNESMESAARRLRLEKWQEICCNMKDFEIHLAHHANDLTENIFLRLFRGANVSGLSGLREFSKVNGLNIRRIMLDFSRQEIEDFLQSENFGNYCIDKSNFDCDIGRNFLRNKLLNDIKEKFPYALKGILRSASVCEKDADFIEQSASLKFAEIAEKQEVENIFYQKLHPALLVRVLRHYLSMKLKYEYIPDWNFMHRFEAMIALNSSAGESKIELDSGYFYIRSNDRWRVVPQKNEIPADVQWNWRLTPEIFFGDYLYKAVWAEKVTGEKGKFYFSADKLTEFLQITVRREGEHFEKFGGGHTSIKEELTNQKIHGFERDRIGILRNGDGEIMLIGGIRRTSFAPICMKNEKIIEISVDKIKK
ncbi:MAG: tRNA lysidine(34) synthetase TilS [Lentisphaeria bacterium]|nr:tRNA lysidine(34) synthetase TilS [Lentisphaeria bacterium]